MHLLKVSWISSQMRKEDGSLSHPIYPSLRSVALSSSSPLGNNVPKLTTQSPQAGSKISPAVLFIIVILAVIFFISGLLHLLVRLLIKQPPSSSSESDRYPEPTSSDVIQRQLQQLFHLHDSGLDQAVIDSLPVFLYKEIIGLNRPFDCAVCLCEFLIEDKLRLLPVCSHAFHVNCIDTWLLSNSSCPLCRGTLFASATITIENPVFNFDDSREEGRFAGVDCEDGISNTYQKSKELDEMTAQKRIFPVRLGKFQSSNDLGETSSSNLDSRRCYSMGSLQYIVGDSNLQVSLGERRINSRIIPKRIEMHGNIGVLDDKEAKKLGYGGKGESFSVSKIWLWPKKGEIPNSSIGINDIYSTNSGFPWISRSEDV